MPAKKLSGSILSAGVLLIFAIGGNAPALHAQAVSNATVTGALPTSRAPWCRAPNSDQRRGYGHCLYRRQQCGRHLHDSEPADRRLYAAGRRSGLSDVRAERNRAAGRRQRPDQHHDEGGRGVGKGGGHGQRQPRTDAAEHDFAGHRPAENRRAAAQRPRPDGTDHHLRRLHQSQRRHQHGQQELLQLPIRLHRGRRGQRRPTTCWTAATTTTVLRM